MAVFQHKLAKKMAARLGGTQSFRGLNVSKDKGKAILRLIFALSGRIQPEYKCSKFINSHGNKTHR